VRQPVPDGSVCYPSDAAEDLATVPFHELWTLLRDRQVDLDHALLVLVRTLEDELEAERATIYLVDHASRELVSRAANLPEIREIRLRLGEGVAGWVAAKGETIRLGESSRDPRFSRRIDAATGYTTRSMLCCPVRDADHTIVAVLQVLNHRNADFSAGHERRLHILAEQVAELLDATSLRSQLRSDAEKPLAFRFNFIVGESGAMQAVYDRVRRAAATEATVLVRGETGTGKELIARAIHFNSERRERPLVKVDCAALPENLIENELFGHERGAFTGADRSTDGKVAEAHGGTLFLDEIGELSLPTQGKLLRLLQDRSYVKVGGTGAHTADLRFVAATHRPLEQMVEEGTFRADLFYRLAVVQIGMPPLRDRGHIDLDRLIDHFLYEHGRRHHRPGVRLSPEARAALHAHRWPGNVRELQHCLESAVVLSPGPLIDAASLPMHPHRATHEVGEGAAGFHSEVVSLAELEQAYVRYVLSLCEGNKSETARRLGIARNTLTRKLES